MEKLNIFCYSKHIYICLLCALNLTLNCLSFELTILHNNDFHSHFEPINVWSSECKSNEQCFGGIARTVAKVKELNESQNNVLFLNGGDHFQGTVWYTFLKWKVVAKFVKLLNHDVMALGNHEFDDGAKDLILFVKNVSKNNEKNLPIVCCNIDTTDELKDLITPSVIVEREGRKIAIIGYITPETRFLARPGPTVTFSDEIECIQKEIKNLKEKHGKSLNIFIAVGHSGFEKDKEIALKIPDLDIVVGGHTNTFLYTGNTPPSTEKPEDVYPVVRTHGGDAKTLVVQAFAFGKYLGRLDVQFDDNGIIRSFAGNPILLDNNTLEDPEVLAEVKEMALEIDEHYKVDIGFSSVFLDATQCRSKECSAGNLLADAFVTYFLDRASKAEKESWTTVPVGIVNGGAVRDSITAGNITMKSVMATCPFGNNVGILRVKGDKLWSILQHSADQYSKGGFLQVSGIKYEFDSKQPIGQRLRSVRVRCADCLTPRYEPINRDQYYSVAITEYIVNGGDGFTIDKDDFTQEQVLDYDVLSAYITKYSPIITGIEDRIVDSVNQNSYAISSHYSNKYSLLFVLFLYQLYTFSKTI